MHFKFRPGGRRRLLVVWSLCCWWVRGGGGRGAGRKGTHSPGECTNKKRLEDEKHHVMESVEERGEVMETSEQQHLQPLKGFRCLQSPGCHRRPWTYKNHRCYTPSANQLLQIAHRMQRSRVEKRCPRWWQLFTLGWRRLSSPLASLGLIFHQAEVFHLTNKVTDSNSRITGADKRKGNNIKGMNSVSHC